MAWRKTFAVLLLAGLAAVSATASRAGLSDPASPAPQQSNTPPRNIALPTISGTTQVGQALTASPGTWTGLQPITYAYQWLSCNSSGGGCASIATATTTTFTLQTGDTGSTLRILVTASNRKDRSSAQSLATAPVTAGAVPPSNASPPAISGTPQAGQTLSATSGTWTGTQPLSYAYQWERCGPNGSNCAPIAGSTTATYTVQTVDIGSTLSVTVTASNTAGSASMSSAVTSQVVAASSSCTGVTVAPGTDLQGAVNANPTGTTFCFQTGTYYLPSSVRTLSYDSFIGQTGVVLDGQGKVDKALWGYGGSAGQTNVTVENIVFQHFTNTAVALGWYANVSGNEMRYNQVGVSINTGSTLNGNYIHDNYQYGLIGGPGSNILIENNEIAHNNTSNYCGGTCLGDASGSKIVGTTAGTYGLTWQNNYVHDNIGVGIWSDGDVYNAVYQNNTVTNNTDAGIFHEVSWNAVIRNNTVTNNDSIDVGLSCWHGAQILVNTSSDVEIYGNTVTASNGANGICAVSADRSETSPYPQAVANLNVHDNSVSMTGPASSGLVITSTTSKRALAVNNRFARNTYYVTSMSAGYWEWVTSASQVIWQGWQSDQQDQSGSLSAW